MDKFGLKRTGEEGGGAVVVSCCYATTLFFGASLLYLQNPWDGTDQSSPAHHMFNESDPILGPPSGFLEDEDEEAQGANRREEEGGTLEECLGLPPSSPSHPSAGDQVEPLSTSYMFFKVCLVCCLVTTITEIVL